MTRSINWKAAIWAGIIAGIVFMMLEMALVGTVGGQSPWGPPRMIAAMALGKDVLPPTPSWAKGMSKAGCRASRGWLSPQSSATRMVPITSRPDFQALNDEGWTIPAASACYWVGEAMHKTDFQDLDQVPKNVASAAKMLASNTAHLARLLKSQPYPGVPQEGEDS